MDFVTFGWILGSIFFSVSIIMVNKKLLNEYGFHCPLFLTSYHFLMTFLLLEIMRKIGLFECATNIPKFQRWYLGGFSIAAVIFQNLSMMYNSLGFYQLAKLCSMPFMVLYDYFALNKKTPKEILVSLAFLMIGLALFSCNDLSFNIFGALVASIAVPVGSMNQIYAKTKQVEYNVNGQALQHAISFQSFCVCIVCAIVAETHGKNSIFTCKLTPGVLCTAFITGILAVGVNVCAFGLIGKTSPLTFTVTGHVKTMLIFFFGILLFPEKRETSDQLLNKILSLCVAMFGVVLYSYFEITLKPGPQGSSQPFVKVPEGSPNEPGVEEGMLMADAESPLGDR